MDARISLLIIGFQLLNLAMAAWDPYSPLVLVGTPPNLYPNKTFPVMVQLSTHPQYQNCVVYSDESPTSIWGAFAYCPQQGQNPKCNYPKWFLVTHYYEGGGPIDTCELEVVYDMMPSVDEVTRQHLPCFQSQGLEYKIVYRICQKDYPDRDREIVVYELCYNEDEKQIIYGNFNIQNVLLLEHHLLRDEQDYPFNFSTNPDHNNVFGSLNEIYQQNPDYVPVSVLPPRLVAFGNQRRPFLNFTNTAPMLRVLKAGWDQLIENLKHKLTTHVDNDDNHIQVTAGLLGHVMDGGRPKILANRSNNFRIKIPRVWCIVILTESYDRGIAIIMHNEIFDRENFNPTINSRSCGIPFCDRALIRDIIPWSSIHFMYCCSAQYIWSEFDLIWRIGRIGLLKFHPRSD